jgi:cytochrome b561
LALALYAIVFLHVVGALKHHFVLKDDVLRRMLPFTKKP